MEMQQIRQGNIFNVDNGLMMRMRVKRFFIDEDDTDSVIIGSTTSLMEVETACPISLLEGVPLTEEIIQDMGFEWEFESAMWHYDGVRLLDNGKLGFSAILTPYDYSLSVPIPYMHTLQNLYFSLKGKEIPVKVSHFALDTQQNTHIGCEGGISYLS